MNKSLTSFCNDLYTILQELDSLVTISSSEEDGIICYNLSYSDYYDDNCRGDEAKNNSKLKKLCDLLKYNLDNHLRLPILQIDASSEYELQELFNTYYSTFKENNVLDTISNSLYYYLDIHNTIDTLNKYSDLPNKEEITNYLIYHYVDKNKNDDKFLSKFIHIFSINNVLDSHRDLFLSVLEDNYEKILNSDKHYELAKQKRSFYMGHDYIRDNIANFIKTHEKAEYVHLYKKYTPYSLEQNVESEDLFRPLPYVIKSFLVNKNSIISKCPLVIDQSIMSNMIHDVIYHLQNNEHINGLISIKDIVSKEQFELEIKLEETIDLEQAIHQIKTLFLDMCVYYNDNILFKHIEDGAKSKQLKIALSSFNLDYEMKIKDSSLSTSKKQEKKNKL